MEGLLKMGTKKFWEVQRRQDVVIGELCLVLTMASLCVPGLPCDSAAGSVRLYDLRSGLCAVISLQPKIVQCPCPALRPQHQTWVPQVTHLDTTGLPCLGNLVSRVLIALSSECLCRKWHHSSLYPSHPIGSCVSYLLTHSCWPLLRIDHTWRTWMDLGECPPHHTLPFTPQVTWPFLLLQHVRWCRTMWSFCDVFPLQTVRWTWMTSSVWTLLLVRGQSSVWPSFCRTLLEALLYHLHHVRQQQHHRLHCDCRLQCPQQSWDVCPQQSWHVCPNSGRTLTFW